VSEEDATISKSCSVVGGRKVTLNEAEFSRGAGDDRRKAFHSSDNLSGASGEEQLLDAKGHGILGLGQSGISRFRSCAVLRPEKLISLFLDLAPV
jgi:hypothetical protein